PFWSLSSAQAIRGGSAAGVRAPAQPPISAAAAASQPLLMPRRRSIDTSDRLAARRGARLELDLRPDLSSGGRLEGRVCTEAPERRTEAAGEAPNRRVVGADRLVEAAPLGRHAVLDALQLVLERQEVLVRLELRIALHGHQQAAQCTSQLALRLLELPEQCG